MEWEHVACSQAVGTIREIGPITGKSLVISMYGSWIPLNDADILVEREYPAWCPAKKQMVLRPNIVYRSAPNQRQLKLKPED
jgi:hypothetical protein